MTAGNSMDTHPHEPFLLGDVHHLQRCLVQVSDQVDYDCGVSHGIRLAEVDSVLCRYDHHLDLSSHLSIVNSKGVAESHRTGEQKENLEKRAVVHVPRGPSQYS